MYQVATPLQYQLIFAESVPVLLVTLHMTLRLYPSTIYAGDPIITIAGITYGYGTHCPNQ